MASTEKSKIRLFMRQESTRRTFGYYLLFSSMGMDIGILGPLLPSLAQQTQVSLAQIGLVFLAGSVGYLIGTTFAGQIFDHIRGHPALGYAQILVAGCVALIPLVPWFWVLFLLEILKGIAQGTVNNGSNTLLVWTHGARVGPYMNGLHFTFGLGAFLSPILVAQALRFGLGYQWVFWVLAVFMGVAGLRVLTLGESPKPANQAGQTLEDGKQRTSLKPILPFILVTALFLFFYVGAELGYAGWLYTYAITLDLTDPARAAYLNSAFWLSFTIGRLLSVVWATRFNPGKIIPLSLAGALVSLLPALILPSSLSALWISTIGAGFCMAPIFPSGVTLAGQSVQLTARITGLIFLGDSLGGMVLPSLLGKVIESAGPRMMMFLVFASLCLNGLTFTRMVKPFQTDVRK